jgi:hypothetical protein
MTATANINKETQIPITKMSKRKATMISTEQEQVTLNLATHKEQMDITTNRKLCSIARSISAEN